MVGDDVRGGSVMVVSRKVSCDGESIGEDSGHPRVYLSIGSDGCVVCPYCGCEFIYRPDSGSVSGSGSD